MNKKSAFIVVQKGPKKMGQTRGFKIFVVTIVVVNF
jgi:hypothetical protein